VLINVSRFNSDGSPFVATDRDPNHPSEIALDGYDNWDYKLQNYNIARLKKDVDNVLWDLRDKIGSEF
jgi:hypothetical protein